MGKILRQPKLWITLASLAFIAVALAQQAGQLRQLSLVANGWWWLSLGLGLTWLSIDQWSGLARSAGLVEAPSPGP